MILLNPRKVEAQSTNPVIDLRPVITSAVPTFLITNLSAVGNTYITNIINQYVQSATNKSYWFPVSFSRAVDGSNLALTNMTLILHKNGLFANLNLVYTNQGNSSNAFTVLYQTTNFPGNYVVGDSKSGWSSLAGFFKVTNSPAIITNPVIDGSLFVSLGNGKWTNGISLVTTGYFNPFGPVILRP